VPARLLMSHVCFQCRIPTASKKAKIGSHKKSQVIKERLSAFQFEVGENGRFHRYRKVVLLEAAEWRPV
jgi:hypothetical protein